MIAAPAHVNALEPHRPSGAVIGWSWVRRLTPILNLYAAGFLVGGAALSAVRYARGRTPTHRDRVRGNCAIAVGGLLPGIGGGLAKAGMVEALYLAEFVGIVLIWIGFRLCTRPGAAPT